MKNIIKTGFLASSLLIAGCATPDGDGPSVQKDINAFTGLFGPLFRASGNSELQQGNFRKANSYYMLSDVTQNQYNKNIQMEAAREGRSQVNFYVQQPALVQPKRFERALGNTDYSFAYTKWVDLDGDKCSGLNEFEGISQTYSLSNIENLVFQSHIGEGFKGHHGKVTIAGPLGQILLSKTSPPLTGDLVAVLIPSTELRGKIPSGQCTIYFDLLSPDKEVVVKTHFDKYSLNFVQ